MDTPSSRRAWRALTIATFLLVCVSILLNVILFRANSTALDQIRAESFDRQDQACMISERTYTQQVRSLRVTYSYLLSLTEKQRKEPINVVLRKELPATEARVRSSAPPAFCSGKGIGLPNPLPRMPTRPLGL